MYLKISSTAWSPKNYKGYLKARSIAHELACFVKEAIVRSFLFHILWQKIISFSGQILVEIAMSGNMCFAKIPHLRHILTNRITMSVATRRFCLKIRDTCLPKKTSFAIGDVCTGFNAIVQPLAISFLLLFSRYFQFYFYQSCWIIFSTLKYQVYIKK